MANEFIARKGLIALADSQITGSLNISQNIVAAGTVQATFASNTGTAISGAFDAASSSLASRITLQENFSSSLDNTFATDADLNLVSSSVDSLNAATSSYLQNTTDTLTGNLTVTGTLTAQDLHVQEITSSIVYSSGSNIFGENVSDTQTFNGSLQVSGSTNYLLGSVGIGTTSPSVRLDTRLSGTTGKVAEFHNSVGYGIGFTVESDGGVNTINAESNQALAFATNGASNERMRIDSSGLVKINTTDVNARFRVNETRTSEWTAGFRHTGTTPYGVFINTSDNAGVYNLGCYTHTGTGFFIKNDGSVGIGITSPNHKLDIYSNENVPLRIHRPSNANLNSSGAWGIGFSTRSDTITSTTDTRAGIFSYYNGNLFFATNTSSIVADPDASARMTILNTGYIGIGTLTPEQKLTVDGTSSGAYVRINNAASGDISSGFMIYNGSNLDTQIYTNPTFGNTTFLTREALAIRAGGSQRMIIKSDGNVGIGTTNPVAKFEVTDGSSSITLQEYSSGAAIFLDGVNGDFTGGDYFHILADSNSYLGLGGYGGGSTPLNISNAGNVIIGATAINGAFGASNTILTVKGSSSGGEGILQIVGLANSATDVAGRIAFHSQAEADPMASIRAVRGNADDVADLEFYTNSGGGAPSKRFEIRSIGGIINHWRGAVSVGQTATNITPASTYGGIAMVWMNYVGNIGYDLVSWSLSGATVLSSHMISGGTSSRTYTASSGYLKLTMGGSDTYSVYVADITNSGA